jgi:hypothetical protein
MGTYKILALLLLLPALCRATSLTFTTDGTIDGGDYDGVTIMSTATVAMTNGSVYHMYIQDIGTLNFYNGTITQTNLWNSGTLNLEGASLTGLQLYNSSTFNLNSGTFDGLLTMGEYSKVNINNGQVVNAWLESCNFGITNVFAGNVTWDNVSLYEYSALNIYGGNVLFNNGFQLGDNAEVNVYYSSVIYDKPGGSVVGYYLLDNSEFMLNQFTYTEIDQINFVPEPATLVIFGFASPIFRYLTRRKICDMHQLK